jgi:gamma-glutamyl phosphate reductase
MRKRWRSGPESLTPDDGTGFCHQEKAVNNIAASLLENEPAILAANKVDLERSF